jgi:hypothetical protein
MGVPKPMHIAKKRNQTGSIMKELERKGLVELNEAVMMELTGGSFLRSITPWAIISSIISNWGDIRQGFSDGYHQVAPRY